MRKNKRAVLLFGTLLMTAALASGCKKKDAGSVDVADATTETVVEETPEQTEKLMTVVSSTDQISERIGYHPLTLNNEEFKASKMESGDTSCRINYEREKDKLVSYITIETFTTTPSVFQETSSKLVDDVAVTYMVQPNADTVSYAWKDSKLYYMVSFTLVDEAEQENILKDCIATTKKYPGGSGADKTESVLETKSISTEEMETMTEVEISGVMKNDTLVNYDTIEEMREDTNLPALDCDSSEYPEINYMFIDGFVAQTVASKDDVTLWVRTSKGTVDNSGYSGILYEELEKNGKTYYSYQSENGTDTIIWWTDGTYAYSVSSYSRYGDAHGAAVAYFESQIS